jgi:hypothetical protein
MSKMGVRTEEMTMNKFAETNINHDNEKATKANRKDRAVLALLQYATVEKAAAAVGLHPSTLYRYMNQPAFKEKLMAARSAAFSQCSARLQQASPAAANRLLRMIMNEDTPPGCVIRACDSILNRGERSFQLEVLEARLSKLENLHGDTAAQKKS